MAINQNVYGAPETWLNSWFLSTGRMKAKCANFTGGDSLVTSSTLGVGNTAGKTPHDTLIDRTIATSALGTESLYCHINYVYGTTGGDVTDIYTDDTELTEFYYCENDRQNQVGARIPQINSASKNDMWKTYATPNPVNFSDRTIPITELNPKKILYILQVLPCNATGTTGSWVIIGDYHNNVGSVRTNYPYISAARLSPRIDNSNSDTPARVAFTDATSSFGIAINRELANSNNSAWKINYTLFRNISENNGIWLYGFPQSFPAIDDVPIVLLGDKNDITQIDSYTYFMHQYSDEFKEYLIRQAACFGVYFRVESTGGAIGTLPLDNDAVFLGVLDDYGIGHGEYTNGAENRNNNIWNWDSYNNSPYDYTVTPDTNTYSNTTAFNTIGGLSTMFKRYVLNGAGVSALGGDLFKIGDDVVIDQSGSYQDYQNIMLNDFLTNNPIDAIISLKKFPLKNIPHDATIENLRLGKVQISTAGYTMPYNSFMYLFKPVDIFPRFGNCFLDYAPYTSIQLYIPFCGTIDLNPDDVMGKRVDVQLLIDFTTGNCDAFISVGNLVIKTASGQCAIDIPVTGTESATVDSQITNGIIQGKNARAKATTDFATANFTPAGLAQSIINPFSAAQNRFENQTNRAQTEYNVTHTQTPLRTIGTCTPVGGWAIDFTCRLIITYPTGAVIDNSVPPRFNDVELQKYGHLIGFATVDSATMNKYAGGLVVADSINLDGVSATDAEKELIIAAVKEGCYI